tara:strand:- start:190 stop:294 length:105 start_codon:yes stop_codon:yes gene_type:complete
MFESGKHMKKDLWAFSSDEREDFSLIPGLGGCNG